MLSNFRISTRKAFWRWPLTLLTCGLLLTGCNDDMTDLRLFVSQAKQKSSGNVDPLPEFQKHQGFVYNQKQLRDPFKPVPKIARKATIASGPQPDNVRQKEALELFPLDSLKMVGVLQQNIIQWGLVKSPDGMIHRVLKGNHAGKNHGTITTVEDEKIVMTELIPDGLGNWVKRTATLALGDEQ